MSTTTLRLFYGLLLFTCCMSAGCDSGGDKQASKPGQKRIIFLTNGNSPFWDAARAGLQEGEREFKLREAGLRAVFEVNDGTPDGQISKLRQFGTQADVVGVAISAVDASNAAVADQMRKLQKKGVHVITVDADIDRERMRDARAYYIGTDNVSGGRALGTAAKHLLEERGIDEPKYVQFVGRTGSHNAIERMNGFKEAVGEKGQELDRMGDDFDRTVARDNVRNSIRNHPGLNTLVGIWSYNAPAIVDVVKETGKRDQFTIITFDAEQIAIQQMGKGQIDAMVVQDPFRMGREAVRLLKAMYQKDESTIAEMYPNTGEPDGDLYETGIKVVAPDEGSPLKAEMFGEGTEFLSLSEFRKWLAKYKLTSS